MDASIRVFRTASLLLMSPILAAVFATPGQCLAGGSTTCSTGYGPFADGCTYCAWHRTWHGPNVLATPLRGYYIPRKPVCCGGSDCAVHCGELIGDLYLAPWEMEAEGEPAADCCPPCMALEPGGMERLGQVPNDLELSARVPGK
jgi:hypothetical protein